MPPTNRNRLKQTYQFVVNNFLKLILIPMIACFSMKLRNTSFDDVVPNECRGEAELVIFPTIMDALFQKTELKPKDRDVLVVNCSLFSPTQSRTLTSISLGSNVKSFNLSGMGCSAGLISIDLANDSLQSKNSNTVVISTEIITPNYYRGKERAMLVSNCLFRMGGAAILLSKSNSNGSL